MIITLIWCLSGILIAEKMTCKSIPEEEYISRTMSILPMILLFAFGPLNYFIYKYFILK